MSKLLTVEDALQRLRDGRQIVLVDDEDRENEGDLCMAAERVTAADVNFMVRYARGLVCLTLTKDRVQRLGLTKMTERNESRFGTNFYVSIEAREGVTTGISAADRAATILAAVAPDADARSVVSPGHVFPICARDGGVLVRAGQTEGSVDLARLAGLEPAGVICEIMKDDGTMARMPDLERFAEEHGVGILTIDELIQYRLRRESLVHQITTRTVIPGGTTREFQLHLFQSAVNGVQFLALVLGEVRGSQPVLVRMHSACIPSDVFGIPSCGCEGRMSRALQLIEQAGAGVFVYLVPAQMDLAGQAGRHLVDETSAGPEARKGLGPEVRDYGLGAQVLAALGLHRIRLMTDNPKRLRGLHSFGLEVVERVSLAE